MLEHINIYISNTFCCFLQKKCITFPQNILSRSTFNINNKCFLSNKYILLEWFLNDQVSLKNKKFSFAKNSALVSINDYRNLLLTQTFWTLEYTEATFNIV